MSFRYILVVEFTSSGRPLIMTSKRYLFTMDTRSNLINIVIYCYHINSYMNGFMFVSTTSTLLVDTTIILSWLPYIKNGGIVENSKLQRN